MNPRPFVVLWIMADEPIFQSRHIFEKIGNFR